MTAADVVVRESTSAGELRHIRETSGAPAGTAQKIALQLVGSFFRRPVLYLLPLILMLALGVFTAARQTKEYQSSGVLNATSGTLLNELTGQTPSFGYESVAGVTARNLQQLLTTDAFIDDLIGRANLTTAVESGVIDRDDVRNSIMAVPRGDNLVSVSATTPNPEMSKRLATAALEGFLEYVVSNDIADATVRIETYEQIRDGYLERLDGAIAELNDFVASHPAGNEELRPVDERLALDRMQEKVSRADDLYQTAEQNVNEARLASNVARTVVARQLRVIDQPTLPTDATSGLRSMVMVVGVFFVVGAIISAGLLVARTLLDRSVRSPDDIEQRFGVEVLAVVPAARRVHRRRSRARTRT
jgi:capsular polysaccharide biosynthesis protein